MKAPEPFTKVMIQTTSWCNSGCIICPSKKLRSVLPQGEMTDPLFEKIITELSELKNLTRVMPYLMNEPLMDKNLV